MPIEEDEPHTSADSRVHMNEWIMLLMVFYADDFWVYKTPHINSRLIQNTTQ